MTTTSFLSWSGQYFSSDARGETGIQAELYSGNSLKNTWEKKNTTRKKKNRRGLDESWKQALKEKRANKGKICLSSFKTPGRERNEPEGRKKKGEASRLRRTRDFKMKYTGTSHSTITRPSANIVKSV